MRRWRPLDTMQFKTFSNCRRPRRKTAQGKVSTGAPPWADKHARHSYLFESAIIDLLQATKQQTQTARLLRCKFAGVNRLMPEATRRGLARRTEVAEVFEQLSIAEKSFQKGHSYAPVLSHPRSARVLAGEAARTKQAWQKLIKRTVPNTQQAAGKTSSMDRWPAFISRAEEELPEADIGHDKFHLCYQMP